MITTTPAVCGWFARQNPPLWFFAIYMNWPDSRELMRCWSAVWSARVGRSVARFGRQSLVGVCECVCSSILRILCNVNWRKAMCKLHNRTMKTTTHQTKVATDLLSKTIIREEYRRRTACKICGGIWDFSDHRNEFTAIVFYKYLRGDIWFGVISME